MNEIDHSLTRRRFLGGALTLLGLAAGRPLAGEHGGPRSTATQGADAPFEFLLLGDLHLDWPADHDMEWLARDHPNDVHQTRDYTRITREIAPRLFAELRQQVTNHPRVAFATQLGDFVEGLAGRPELARHLCTDAIQFVRSHDMGVPILITKGNHDITGPGGAEAFDEILLPFIGKQAGKSLTSASYTYSHGNALYAFFDAYHPDSLSWLEEVAARRKERHLFVLLHPPVVPYGARSTWHLYSRPAQAPQRERLLSLLGRHRAIVLCAHIHKYSALVRETAEGPFFQFAMISVIPAADIQPKQVVTGVDQYTPEQVKLEPNFSPATEPERRAALKAEAPFIRFFEYADAPGYGRVRVDGDHVTADLFIGLGRRRWRTLDLTGLLARARRRAPTGEVGARSWRRRPAALS